MSPEGDPSPGLRGGYRPGLDGLRGVAVPKVETQALRRPPVEDIQPRPAVGGAGQ